MPPEKLMSFTTIGNFQASVIDLMLVIKFQTVKKQAVPSGHEVKELRI
jgi:hypothetical protein